MAKKSVIAVTCLLILIFLLSSIPAMAQGSDPERYTTTTQDGVQLVIKRYRPDSTAAFREGEEVQPIILMPGILCNNNTYDIRTPEGENYNEQLPANLAEWAQGDPYIQADPMRYHSLAHYLWLQGYDVWMPNYRAEGRGEYQSGGYGGYSLDDLGIYDCPAVVEKVFDVTGKHPIWVGHSMGSSMAYMYFEGARYGTGLNPHVVLDQALADERNGGNGRQSVKAFIDIDGPMIPFSGAALDNPITWLALYWGWYLDLRFFTPLAPLFASPLSFICSLSWRIARLFGLPDLGPLNLVLTINPENMTPNLISFMIKYMIDGSSTRVMAQYLDASAHGVFREDYTNGTWAIIPPNPADGDGYTAYSKNLTMIKLPSLVLADDRRDITNPDDIKNFYLGKTRNGLDTFLRVPVAAHMDLVCGNNTATITFPTIGDWLKQLPL